MKDLHDIGTLTSTILRHLEVLDKLEAYYDDYLSKEVPPFAAEREKHHAIVISDIFEKYYTCLETIFFRISAFFENNLGQDRWHQDLLERMLLRIDGVRERAREDLGAFLTFLASLSDSAE